MRFFSRTLLAALLLAAALPVLAAEGGPPLRITGMKTAHGVDDRYAPVDPARDFPPETSSIHCWFAWQNAEGGAAITANWRYLTENVTVLEHPVSLPKKEGAGSIALIMPQGKTFPPGTYQVALKAGQKILKSIRFRVT